MQGTSKLSADDRPVVVVGLGAIVLMLGLLVTLDGRVPTGPTSAVIVATALFAGSAPVLAAIARRDEDRRLFGFLLAAMGAKLLGGLARYYVMTAAYDGLADAARYDAAGREWVTALKAGRPVMVVDSMSNFGAGTKALSTITGIVYSLAGRNIQTGFVVFAWLGFWGLVLAYRAFRVGFPDGDRRRYRLLLFFLPSLVFWPSSIGKDAWMQLSLGAVLLGVAWLIRPSPRLVGIAWLAIGLVGAALLRPHIALAALAPLGVVLVLRHQHPHGVHKKGHTIRVAAVAVLGVGALLLLNRLGAVFGNEGDPSAGSVGGVLDTASTITAQGGSEFDADAVSSITDLPMATVSVLLRPFIWEATSAVKAVAGLETTLLLILTIGSWRRLRTLPFHLRSNKYVVYAALFALVSIIGFSRVGNEGILARQRTQFLPAALVLLSLPVAVPTGSRRVQRSGRADTNLLLGTVDARGSTMPAPFASTTDHAIQAHPQPARTGAADPTARSITEQVEP